jgi:c-di-GMP-binding flagellar brake protein YcgR
MEDRRKHKRYPVLHEMDQTIQIAFNNQVHPGVLVELSAGGMALLTFNSIPIGTEINMSLDLPGLKTRSFIGKIVWSLSKGEMWRMGIAFTKIDPVDFRHINRMGFDYVDCDTKLQLGVTDVCSDKCSFFVLCHKPQKLHIKKAKAH